MRKSVDRDSISARNLENIQKQMQKRRRFLDPGATATASEDFGGGEDVVSEVDVEQDTALHVAAQSFAYQFRVLMVTGKRPSKAS
jgi:ubiquinone/menaquinone biosynthesis C-methylase UbiE